MGHVMLVAGFCYLYLRDSHISFYQNRNFNKKKKKKKNQSFSSAMLQLALSYNLNSELFLVQSLKFKQGV